MARSELVRCGSRRCGGAQLESSHDNHINDNRFSGNYQGIALSVSNGNKLNNNVVTQSEADGIVLFGSSGNTLRNNQFNDNVWGIWLQSNDSGEQQSTGNIIAGNEVLRNLEDGVMLIGGSDDNVIRKNTVANNGTGIILLGIPEFGLPIPAGNALYKNVATGNSTDLLEITILDFFGDFEISTDNECENLWNDNTFDSALGPMMCIE